MAKDTGVVRAQILDATLAQISARGIAAVRVADVAGACGISSGLVHYHFVTKERLISDAFAREAARDLTELDRILASSAPVAERLVRALRLYGPEGDARGWRIWLDGWSEAMRNDELREALRVLVGRWRSAVAGLIREGVADGVYIVEDADHSAVRILSFADGVAVGTLLWEDDDRSAPADDWIGWALGVELAAGRTEGEAGADDA